MKYEIKIKEGEAVLSLPRDKLLELLSDCTDAELKTLIAVCAEPECERALELTGLEAEEFNSALAYWRGAKLVRAHSARKRAGSVGEAGTHAKKEKQESKNGAGVHSEAVFDDRLREYTRDEIKRISENDKILSSILDEAQQVFGKVFNSVEMNYIIAMRDHLGLDGEYILMLLQYFRSEGKALCYAVRVADSLVKKGISDPEALEAYIKRRDSFKGSEGKYRDLFGIGTRALTAYEEKYFHIWSQDMKMPFELVKLAFDRTVEKKGTPQKSYINGILKSWHGLSLHSEEEVEAYEQKSKESGKKTAADAASAESFDVNEFFNAALERTYGKKE